MTTVELSNPAPSVPDGAGAPLAPGELMRLAGEYLTSGGVPVRLAGDHLLIAPGRPAPVEEEGAGDVRRAVHAQRLR